MRVLLAFWLVGCEAVRLRWWKPKQAEAVTSEDVRMLHALETALFEEGDLRHAVQLMLSAYAAWWRRLFRESPEHVAVETLLIVFVVFLLLKGGLSRKDPKPTNLTEAEIDELVADWEPAPLVPEPSEVKEEERLVVSMDGAYVRFEGSSKPLVNFGAVDALGLSSDQSVKAAAKSALKFYGCGSCGPRGFYGSIDVHIELERRIAEFCNAEKAIVFSDASSCCTSTVAAFAKRGDLLIVDEGISEPLQTGCVLSRATVATYAHCDYRDLERVLESIKADDARKMRRPGSQRRFVVCEAIFRDFGTISPLREIVALKDRYGYRLICDESLSFGAIGKTGRGAKEHFSLAPDAIDITTLDLGPVLGSVGGVCHGSAEIIDHQRLSGAGYCFSAAAPPFVSAAAVKSLDILRESQIELAKLREKIAYVHAKLDAQLGAYKLSKPPSPLILVQFEEVDDCRNATMLLEKAGFALACSAKRKCKTSLNALMRPKPIALQLCINAHHTLTQIDTVCDALVYLHAKFHP